MNDSRPRTVEIIGPSGAGKSTLSRLLNDRSDHVRAGVTIWGLSRRVLYRSAVCSIPSVAYLRFRNPGFDYAAIKQVVRLRAFHHFWHRGYRILPGGTGDWDNVNTLFLDEGPVFAIAKLRVDLAEYPRSMKRWEKSTLQKWAEILDGVVWLDAPDDVLIERIRTREKAHRMKYKSESEVAAFLTRFRTAYKTVLDRIACYKSIEVSKYDTAVLPLDEIAANLTKEPTVTGKLHRVGLDASIRCEVVL